ncbi:exported hypothetical protein [uncultured spirochete]|uniref:Uncharacterized protein n=1 Tax=uncultured spirochete TaxID=156406 RepID=A0A3P3XJ23_9SPIR|nr:exported hypothetical protein [uncultured spirochete]
MVMVTLIIRVATVLVGMIVMLMPVAVMMMVITLAACLFDWNKLHAAHRALARLVIGLVSLTFHETRVFHKSLLLMILPHNRIHP